MAVKFTEEMIDDIVEKYQNGMSVKELAKTFSAHEQTITSKLKQRKVFAHIHGFQIKEKEVFRYFIGLQLFQRIEIGDALVC